MSGFKQSVSGIMLSLSFLAGIATLSGAATAVPNFNEAVKKYTSGQYALALQDFQQFEAAYPTNGLVRYYEALCYQGLNRLDKAKAQYEWVAANCQGSLKAQGIAGVAKLANAHTTIAMSGGPPSMGMGTGGGSTTAAASTTAPAKKVKKILEFYADW